MKKSFTPTPKLETCESRLNNRRVLVRGFTLIELIVSISILAVIAAASIPALFVHQKRAQLDEVKTQLKDVILSTQNYAMAPGAIDIKEYVLVINKSSSAVPYNHGNISTTIPAKNFRIYSFTTANPSVGAVISNGVFSSDVAITTNAPFNGNPSTISYRTKDYAVSFDGIYPDETGFNSSNLVITLTESGQSRNIKIQNTTGAVSVE